MDHHIYFLYKPNVDRNHYFEHIQDDNFDKDRLWDILQYNYIDHYYKSHLNRKEKDYKDHQMKVLWLKNRMPQIKIGISQLINKNGHLKLKFCLKMWKKSYREQWKVHNWQKDLQWFR